MTYTPRLTPYEHQVRGVDKCNGDAGFAYLAEMGCVDCATEYLSPTGWRRMDNYDGGLVAQFNLDGTAEFVQPSAYIRKPVDRFTRFTSSRGCDQVLSLDHRILSKYSEPNSPWWEYTPRQLEGTKTKPRAPAAFVLTGGSGIPLTDDQIRLQVAFMADGSYGSRDVRTHKPSRVGFFGVKKGYKKERISHLLTVTGTEFRVRDGNNGFTHWSFKPPLATKTYPSDWYNATLEQRRVICDEVFRWDGNPTRNPKAGSSTYSSIHETDADFIQWCLSSTGRRARKFPRSGDGTFLVHAVGTEGRTSNFVFLMDKEHYESPDGMMYCFSVPSTYLVFRRNGCVFASGNTGKSAMLLLDWGRLYDANEVDDFLLVAPAGVYRNWEGEVNAHMDPEVRERARVFTWRAGGGVTFKRDLEHFLRHPDRSRPRIFLTNSESYQTNTGLAVAAREFLKGRRGMVAVDESTLMKNHLAKRTKTIVDLKYDAPYRRIAAGLPNPNSPLDLFSQFEFLDRRFLGHANFHTYQSHFCITRRVEMRKPGGAPVLNRDGTIKKRTEVVSFRNLEELKARVAAHSFRVTKDECLDLPPKVYMPLREVQMHPEQRRIYDEIKKNAVATLGDGSRVTSQQVITQLLRLQQVLCGHAVDESGTVHEVPEYRTDALIEEADAVGGKAIIWTIYRHSLAKLRQRLTQEFGPQSVVMYYGDTPSDERQQAIWRFQNDPDCLFFLSNQQTGGRGITLTAAQAVIYHSNSPDLELRLQSEDRAHRAGLNHSVAYCDLHTPGSVDTRWVRALRNKMDVASSVLGDGVRNWLV